MKDLREMDILFECGYNVQIKLLYEPVLDGILVISKVLNKNGYSFVIIKWKADDELHAQDLAFDFIIRGITANKMNALWSDLSSLLDCLDRHWTIVFNGEIVHVEYDVNKMLDKVN